MNCIIVDDNEMARAVLKEIISQYAHLNLVAECENPIQAINILKNENVDLIFLDIEMPKMSGLDFLKSMDKRPLVILITAKKDYALEAFEYNVVDYLVTPVAEERFFKAISKAQDLFETRFEPRENNNKDFIFIREKGVLLKIKVDDILYVQALGDYVVIYLPNKRYTVRMNLRIAEGKLSPEKFMRVHRSYIIAIDKLDSIEESTASIGEALIPIGDNYRTALVKKLNLF